jgi:hypothetical protein
MADVLYRASGDNAVGSPDLPSFNNEITNLCSVSDENHNNDSDIHSATLHGDE